MPSTICPTIWPTRSFISRAALLVKVTARISRGPRAPEVEDVRDARGEHAGFAGSRAGQHQHRPVQRLHRFPLLGVEVGEIGRSAGPERTRGNAARNRLRAQWSGVVTRVVTFGLGHVVR